ncbi:winged helix-turn-helix domain-containing protein [Streptomyces sp. NPDC006365]|uniref:helix-turn-helix domain-containing protein n=1 Tax=Streptomyces sp. NPDC006365 TaxID=3364744 RepID=UPI00368CABEE
MGGLKSKGPSKLPRLSDDRFAVLEKELAKGPAAYGWQDQRWTLERVRTLTGRQFEVSCSIAGVWRLLHRHGWSWQSPARRALGRDEHAVELWRSGGLEEGRVAADGSTAAALDAWIVFEEEAGSR